MKQFPSPTGVNYYEFDEDLNVGVLEIGFRPQQGLTIMNVNNPNLTDEQLDSFRPQQGLTIMNIY